MTARIVSIHLCQGHRKPMGEVPAASLAAGIGLEGDHHARPASSRQVLLVDKEALDTLGLSPGTVRENLTVEGLDVMRLAAGTRLRLGSGAVLEITSVCEPCFRMDEIRSGLRLALAGRRGMNSRVIQGGRVDAGDRILVDPPSPLGS